MLRTQVGHVPKEPSSQSSNEPVRLKHQRLGRRSADRIGDLAALQVTVRQGDPFEPAPVYVSVSCGRPVLTIGNNHTVRLATWQVVIRLALENARLKSVRRVEIQKGSFASGMKSQSSMTNISQHQRQLGLDGDAALTVSSMTGRLGAKFGLSRNKQSTDNTQVDNVAHRDAEVLMIYKFGHGIAIGDDIYGDPYQDKGLLISEYPRPKDGEDEPPLFEVEPIDPSLPMVVTVTATVPMTKLCPLLISNLRPSKGYDLPAMARGIAGEVGAAAAQGHLEALRQRMAGDALFERIAASQRPHLAGLGLAEGEIAVEIESFEMAPIFPEGTDDRD